MSCSPIFNILMPEDVEKIKVQPSLQLKYEITHEEGEWCIGRTTKLVQSNVGILVCERFLLAPSNTAEFSTSDRKKCSNATCSISTRNFGRTTLNIPFKSDIGLQSARAKYSWALSLKWDYNVRNVVIIMQLRTFLNSWQYRSID